ncbi:MAG: bifunctional phosphoglucose/phosphomannose isomerase [Candidatus Thorarchaeota archaeon]|nr:bifunctional phosphoglucose/phosphomannose isomerase [Candidatus Thorarchaeota archaeon]
MTEENVIHARDMSEMVGIFPDLLTTIQLDPHIRQRAASLHTKGISGICLIGMGGSSITGEISKGLLATKASVTIITSRDYHLPAAVNKGWVVIAVSYSGNTEETLSALKEARHRECIIFGITTGGELERLLKTDELQKIPAGLQPRAALPLMFSVIYPLLTELVDPHELDMPTLSRELSALREQWSKDPVNSPHRIARLIMNTIPLFIGGQHLAAIAYRAKCQINENAKAPAMSVELPEMDHNEIEACGEYASMGIRPIFLRSGFEDERIKKRVEATRAVFQEAGVEPLEIPPMGSSRVMEALATALFVDEISLEYANLREVDSVGVLRIKKLKEILSRE